MLVNYKVDGKMFFPLLAPARSTVSFCSPAHSAALEMVMLFNSSN